MQSYFVVLMGKKQASQKSAQLGIEADRDSDFGKWYTQIVTRADLIEYYDVSGCYVLVGFCIVLCGC